MNFNKIRNLKHKELWLRYQENKTILSTSYANYINRILRYGQTKEDAIKISNNIRKPNAIKTMVDQNGRECTICGIYKDRGSYHNSKSGVYRKTNDCKDCRNKKRQQYREKTNRIKYKEYKIKDKEYKKRTRTLKQGEIIAMTDPVIYEDNPREDKYKVIGYKKGKGYTIKSLLHGGITRIITGDNKNSPYCKKFYRVKEEVTQEVEEVRNMDNYFSGLPC